MTHTTGALRAARRIKIERFTTCTEAADIIDEETHVSDMLEALEHIAYELLTDDMEAPYRDCYFEMMRVAKEALKKVRG